MTATGTEERHGDVLGGGGHGTGSPTDVEHITLELFQNGILLSYEVGKGV